MRIYIFNKFMFCFCIHLVIPSLLLEEMSNESTDLVLFHQEDKSDKDGSPTEEWRQKLNEQILEVAEHVHKTASATLSFVESMDPDALPGFRGIITYLGLQLKEYLGSYRLRGNRVSEGQQRMLDKIQDLSIRTMLMDLDTNSLSPSDVSHPLLLLALSWDDKSNRTKKRKRTRQDDYADVPEVN